MPVFEIKPVFIDGTDAAAEWVDNEHSAWNEPLLRTTAPLADRWEAPSLELYRSEKIATAVLFHPTAHVVSQGVRDELSHFPELEFLPVDVAGYGQFYAMHVLTSCELPAGSIADKASAAPRSTPNARSPAARSSALASGGRPDSNIAA